MKEKFFPLQGNVATSAKWDSSFHSVKTLTTCPENFDDLAGLPEISFVIYKYSE